MVFFGTDVATGYSIGVVEASGYLLLSYNAHLVALKDLGPIFGA